jgi:hypothetical protein
MKVREFGDGSHQFVPEEGDAEFPVAPVLPLKSIRLLALESMEAEVVASDDVKLKVELVAEKEYRKREEAQHAANVAANNKAKADLASFPAAASGSGARVLTAAQMNARPWLKVKV